MVILSIIALAFILLCSIIASLRWNEVRYGKKGLPPGTMGWPLFGETSDFIKTGPQFIKNRRARYGELFKSHVLGCPTVISTDPALNRYILLNEGRGLIPGYPQSMLDLLGKWNIAAVQSSLHKTMRGAMLALISPSMIKDHLLSDINNFMDTHLQHWNGHVINLQEKTKEMALLVTLKQAMSINSGPKAEAFMLEFYKLVEGTLSLPIYLPGTNYRRGFQARENILKMLREVLRERRASTEIHNDIIAMLLNGKEEEEHSASATSKLTDEQILDLLISIINAGFETVSTTSMMAVKYLHDCPEALRELREEHLAIQRKKNPGETINWDDYKSMKFTQSVIFETLRLATIINGVLRKTTQDMEMKGFIIPKGWRIYVYMAETNHDNFLYPDSSTFNPWRWQEKNNDSLYFMAFGGGSRLCPGKELGLVEISVFLHYFVTRYRWEEVGGDEILSFPRVVAPKGFHIKVSEY